MNVAVQPKRAVLRSVPRRRRVLAVCGDKQVGLWTIRSLGRAGLAVFNVGLRARGLPAQSRYVAGAYTMDRPFREDRFIDEVARLSEELDVGSILTIAERYHLALVRHRERFEPRFHLFSPSAEAFHKATDKDFMRALAQRLGVPVARGTTLDRFLAEGNGGGLRFPLVVRTRRLTDAGGDADCPWKVAYARNREELDRLHAAVRGIASNVIVQEYHPGVEDHIQILMHNGEAFMVGEYIGEHHMPLAGGVTVQRVSCRHPGLERDAVRLLQAIGWEGAAGVQFHYDPRTGRYIFLEINPRFIGGMPTVVMAGFDVPYLLWQSHFEPDRMRRTRYRLGVRTRILGGDANWLLGMLRRDPLPPDQAHPGRLRALAEFLWNFGPWTRDDVFWWHDPKPFFVDLGQMVRKLRDRTVDLIGNPAAGEGPA